MGLGSTPTPFYPATDTLLSGFAPTYLILFGCSSEQAFLSDETGSSVFVRGLGKDLTAGVSFSALVLY